MCLVKYIRSYRQNCQNFYLKIVTREKSVHELFHFLYVSGFGKEWELSAKPMIRGHFPAAAELGVAVWLTSGQGDVSRPEHMKTSHRASIFFAPRWLKADEHSHVWKVEERTRQKELGIHGHCLQEKSPRIRATSEPEINFYRIWAVINLGDYSSSWHYVN